jgi:eukaryotic-like serine/threonine-protein kinase
VEDSRIGEVLDGRYQIIERLARGGMGTVYRGERIGLGRVVAIKFLHEWVASDPAMIKRFELEAQAMARLEHPNCAQVIDVGVVAQSPYVVMELVKGRPLSDILDEGAIEPARAIEIIRQVLAALNHSHSHEIVHRDIKPSNIVISSSEEFGDQVKVLDFGLAKFAQDSSNLTGVFIIGTPSYIPPEQSRGETVDGRTDLYAAGVVLFEMLTGSPPFVGDDSIELIDAHRNQTAPRLVERLVTGVFSPELERIVARALAKQPSDRFSSAAEMARALESVSARVARAGTSPPTAPVPSPQDSSIQVTRHGAPSRWKQLTVSQWAGIVIAGIVLLTIVIAAIVAGDDEQKTTLAVSNDKPTAEPAAPETDEDRQLQRLQSQLRGADTSDEVLRGLQRSALRQPKNAEIPLAVGQVYCERLWVSDCLQSFRKAIAIDAKTRNDPRLIDSAMFGLGNDRAHQDVRRFIANEIGAAAIPSLKAVTTGRWRKEVKERAAATLADLNQQ